MTTTTTTTNERRRWHGAVRRLYGPVHLVVGEAPAELAILRTLAYGAAPHAPEQHGWCDQLTACGRVCGGIPPGAEPGTLGVDLHRNLALTNTAGLVDCAECQYHMGA